ncbi:uncharacterized protein N7511_003749 [Penicillium nucicola]|uniref:uncharacterized protein n=1 Tax=Penicillium nucicola TaxID=1850975 RepID=UPI0025450557|nr:uncharacterized protein N7511_003749 [Penicillium nucicola]KAJ5766133.1 hypothetical protein N7511_003749 [Penicillium nucicola]
MAAISMIEWLWASTPQFDFWKCLLTVFLVVNIKNLPLVFHYRIFRPIIQNVFKKKSRHQLISIQHGNKTLPLAFLPCITTTYTPMLEADYNLHKSNSTYFTDLDASRSHLLSTLCYSGIPIVDQELAAEGKSGMLAAIIGSVTTSFKKEIRIFQQYEVWSRILTWDQKWLYIVTHFVQKGSVKHQCLVAGTVMLSGEHVCAKCGGAGRDGGKPGAGPVVFATSVSKYVFKKGRFTVAPERLLKASGLLGGDKMGSEDFAKHREDTDGTTTIGQVVENERLQGLKYAHAWNELESLHSEFVGQTEKGDSVPAIGRFDDISGHGFSYC